MKITGKFIANIKYAMSVEKKLYLLSSENMAFRNSIGKYNTTCEQGQYAIKATNFCLTISPFSQSYRSFCIVELLFCRESQMTTTYYR